MKELEKELSQKTSSLSELKQQLKEVKEREEKAHAIIRQLEDQVGINEGLAHAPQHNEIFFTSQTEIGGKRESGNAKNPGVHDPL